MGAACELLERDRELREIEETLASVHSGAGRVLLLEGAPGIGKTTMVDAACRIAGERGALVLRATAAALEEDLSWGVVRSALGGQLADPRRRELLLTGAAAVAAPLFTSAESPQGADAIGAILHGLYWLISDLAAERPLALVIDDAHWVDAPSARWLSHLAARVSELSVALVIAARPASAQSFWSAIAAAQTTGLLRLEPLSRTATRTLVSRVIDGPREAIADACFEATAGNPFLLGELLRQLSAQSAVSPDPEQIRRLRPETIRRAVLVRLAQLGSDAAELSFAISILGSEATVALAAQLARLSAEDAEAAAIALERAEVIRTVPRLEFVHPLALDVVTAEVPPVCREALHLKAATLLGRNGAGPSVIAPHLLASAPGGRAEVVETLRAAAAEAVSLGVTETAAACLRRALEEPPGKNVRQNLLIELGRVEAMLAAPEAVERLGQALAGSEDLALRGRVALDLALQLAIRGQVSEAVALLSDAAQALPVHERELDLQLRAQAQIMAAQSLPASEPDSDVLDTARSLKGETAGERAFLAIVSNLILASPAPLSEVRDFSTRALRGTILLNEATADSALFTSAVTSMMFAEEYFEAERLVTAGFVESARRGSVRGHGNCCWLSGALRLRLGRLREASDDARRSHELFGAEPMLAAYPLAFLTEALIEQGELTAARAAIDKVLGDQTPPLVSFALLLGSDARLRRLEGDAAGAAARIREAGALLGEGSPALWPWRAHAALAMHAAGAHDEATAFAREEVRRGEQVGSRWVLAQALHALAVVQQSVDPLLRAEELTRGWPTKLERARVLTELGSMLRRSGRTRDAQPHLREGLDLADRCGAVPLAARAREELIAAGARPRRARLSGVDALTASELRVCRMAADGASNRQIAQALFVSLRTVETHLTKSYGKLGIVGRDGLAAALWKPPASRFSTDDAGGRGEHPEH